MSRQAAGFTLVEVSVVLLAALVVLSIVWVNISDFNRLTRFARVQEDVTRLCSALARLILDTGDLVSHDPAANPDANGLPVGLLIGDGRAPGLNRQSPGAAGAAWLLAEGNEFEQPTDSVGAFQRFTVDMLANHLLHNTPLGEPRRGYRMPSDTIDGRTGGVARSPTSASAGEQGFDSLFAWRGPYIADRIDADPWGNRYMTNVFSLYTPRGDHGAGFSSAVVCYSAGADEEVDTAFNQPTGWVDGDDDVSVLVAVGGHL